MPVDSNDFLIWSESEVKAQNLTEFGLRNASSRAYYALFHAARGRVKALGVKMLKAERGGSHESLIQTIQSISVLGKEIGDDMQRLKKFRHFCDYDIADRLDTLLARKHIIAARRIIGRLSELH